MPAHALTSDYAEITGLTDAQSYLVAVRGAPARAADGSSTPTDDDNAVDIFDIPSNQRYLRYTKESGTNLYARSVGPSAVLVVTETA